MIIYLMQVLVPRNSDLYVAVLEEACFFEYHIIGVRLSKWKVPVIDLPDKMSYIRFTSYQCAKTTLSYRFVRICR